MVAGVAPVTIWSQRRHLMVRLEALRRLMLGAPSREPLNERCLRDLAAAGDDDVS